MSDAEITPSERPATNARNTPIVEELSRIRCAVTDWTKQLGDLERTIRLSDKEVDSDARHGIARIIEGTAQDMLSGAHRIKEAS